MQRSSGYTELLTSACERPISVHAISDSQKAWISLSTVNYALRPTEEMGAIRKTLWDSG